jgi:hypothetical protein
MAISDEQFKAFVKDQSNRLIFLARIAHYENDVDGEQWLNISKGGYISKPDDTPADTPFPNDIVKVPQLRIDLSSRSLNWGALDFRNNNGKYDYLLDSDFSYRSVEFYLGGPDWDFSDFRKIFVGHVAKNGFSAPDHETLSVTFIDRLSKAMEQKIPPDGFEQTILDANGESIEVITPITFGKCFNITPVYIGKDGSGFPQYQVSFCDGAGVTVYAFDTVKDNGITLTAGVNYLASTSTGVIKYISGTPTEPLTADVKGLTISGSYIETASEIIQTCLKYLTDLTDDDLDLTSFANLPTYELGIFIKDTTTIGDVINQILTSFDGWLAPTLTGKIRAGMLPSDLSVETSVYDLYPSNIVQHGLTISDTIPPIKSVLFGYKKNYTPIDKNSVGAALSEDFKDLFDREWSTHYAKHDQLDTDFYNKYLGAGDLALEDGKEKVYETVISNQSDVVGVGKEAERKLELYSTVHRIYDVQTFADAFLISAGDVITLHHHRYGFDSPDFDTGAKALVYSVELDIDNREGRIQLWR